MSIDSPPPPSASSDAGSDPRLADIFATTVEAASILLTDRDLSRSMNAAVGVLGKRLGVDRVWVRTRDLPARTWTVCAEWARDSVLRRSDQSEWCQICEDDFEEVFRDKILKRLVYEAVPSLRTDANPDSAAAIRSEGDLIIPVVVKDEVWGCVGLNHGRQKSVWSNEELSVLQSVSMAIAGAVERQSAESMFARDLAAVDARVADIFSATVEAANILLADRNVMRAITNAIAVLGDRLEVDRVGVLSREMPQRRWILRAEWIRPGMPSWIDQPEWTHLQEDDFPELFRDRILQRLVFQSVQSQRSPAYAALNAAIASESDLLIPIVVRDQVWGLIGFDDCRQERTWSKRELVAIQSASAAIAGAVEREFIEQEFASQLAQTQIAAAEERARELGRRDRLLSAVALFAKTLNEPGSIATNLEPALAHLLNADGISRVLVGRNETTDGGERIHRFLWEVTAPGVSRQSANPDANPVRFSDVKEVFCVLEAGGVVNTTSDGFDPAFGHIQSVVGAKAVLALPVTVRGEWWGSVGFDNCVEPRTWTEPEIDVLRGVAAGVSSALTRELVEEESRAAAVRAAEDRARELGDANERLTRSLVRLAGAADQAAFVTAVHRELCDLLDGVCTAQFQLEWDARKIVGGVISGVNDSDLDAVAGVLRLSFGEIPAWRDDVLCDGRVLRFDPAIDAAVMSHATVEFMQRNRLTWLLNLPLVVDGVPQWVIAVLGRDPSKLTDRNLELFRQLGSQLTLALELQRLGEAAKAAAVAQERQVAAEQRVAEAKRISDFLVRIMGGMAGGDLPTVFERITLGLAGALHAAHVYLLRHSPATNLIQLQASVIEGQYREGMSGAEFPLFAAPFPADITPAWRVMCEQRCLFTPEMSSMPVEEFAWPGALEYAARYELSDMGHVVLFCGDAPVGSIGVSFRHGRKITVADKTFIEAAAQQTAVAVRLLDLAVTQRDAAVAAERQAAAEQRAAELAAVNATLARSLSAVSGSTDFEQILDVVFREVVRAAAAAVGFLFVHDPVANTLTTQTWIDEHGSGRGCCPNAPPLLAGPFDADVTPAFRRCIQARRSLGVVDHKNPAPEEQELLWPGVIDWHLSRGRVASCAIPVMCGEQPLGVIGLAWHSSVEFTPLQTELLFALTNQVAIVLQLSDVAAARRAAVVAQERQAAAEASAEQLARRDQLLTAAAQCAEVLAHPGTFAKNMPSALRHLLNAEGISRVTLMRNDRLPDGSFAMMLEYECAVAGVPMQRDTPGAFPARFEDYAAVVDILSRGEVVNEFVDYLQSTAADIQSSLGVKSGLQIPLFIGETWWGTLAFDNCVERRVWLEAEVQVLRSAAAGVVSAINRERAEEELRAVAVRAAEARAAELTAVNKLLVESLESFTADLDDQAFITLILKRLSAVLEMPVVELWYARHGERKVYPGPLYHDARVWTPAETEHPMQKCGFPVPTTYELTQAVVNRRQIICDRISQHPQIPSAMSQWYFDRFGVDKMINLPLVVGRMVTGAVIGFAHAGHEHTVPQVELAHALAGQLALALHLRELNEQAKTVAALEADERAARERAEVLGRLNRVLVRGAERVAAASDPYAVVIGFLQEAKAIVGAFCAAVYRRLEGTRHMPMAVIVDGRVFSPAEITASPLFARVEEWTASDPGGLFTKLTAGESVFLPISDCEPCLFPELARYHRSVGNATAWYLPLQLGGRNYGHVALGVARDTPPTETERHLLAAIRQHLTLALELSRLADRDRQAAVLAERTRLARDIHDTLAQGFLGVMLQLEAARLHLPSNVAKAERFVATARELANSNLNEARRSVGMLRTAMSDQEDLVSQLSQLACRLSPEGETTIRFESTITAFSAPPDVVEQVVRIMAEAIQNARRHSHADQIQLIVSRAGSAVRAAVIDNGVGFDLAASLPDGHYGLLGMKERATTVKCDFSVVSVPGRGTTVMVTWPANNLPVRSHNT